MQGFHFMFLLEEFAVWKETTVLVKRACSRCGFASKMEEALSVLQTCSETIPRGGLSCTNLFHNDWNVTKPRPWESGKLHPQHVNASKMAHWRACRVLKLLSTAFYKPSCFLIFMFCFVSQNSRKRHKHLLRQAQNAAKLLTLLLVLIIPTF